MNLPVLSTKPCLFSQNLALEMQALQNDSGKYKPASVAAQKADSTGMADQQNFPYPQFLVIVKQQVSYAKDMYDQISEFLRNFNKSWYTGELSLTQF